MVRMTETYRVKKNTSLLYYKSHCHIVNSTVPSLFTRTAFRPRILPLFLLLGLLAGCGEEGGSRHPRVEGGDADTGKRLMTQYQCSSCHQIPNVPGPQGEAGPSLEHVGRLSYIAGGIPNQADRMVAWLRDPPALKPGTRMPSMGLSEQEARHMAAYLYTLR
jgi:cytochrome c